MVAFGTSTGYISRVRDATLSCLTDLCSPNQSEFPLEGRTLSLTPPRMLLDIRGQSASLDRVLGQQCGVGRLPLLEAAALLRSAKRVVIVGIGASLNAAIPLENL